MTYKDILYSSQEYVALITLNRPKRLNAMTRRMAAEVRSALHAAAEDEEVRVIVLTGAGRGFCAGADLAELEERADEGVTILKGDETGEQAVSILTGVPTEEEFTPANPRNIRPDFRKRYSFLNAIDKPIIAAINGPVAGVGLVYALHCDIRFASNTAKFSTAFSRRGLIAEHGIAWLLPRIVGFPNAMELLFSARLLDSSEALNMNLVSRVFAEESFMENVLFYAAELANQVSPRSLRVMKKQLYEAQFQSLAEAAEAADEALVECLQSEDFAEGVDHFMEKRPPKFTGR